jgi:hypothetical protein
LREILTILAIVLIVFLTAVLAVPYLINWNAQRHLVEAQLSNLTGASVKIRGGIDLKILPTPYLQLSDVELSAPSSGTDVKVAALRLEIALPSLMRGDVDFVEARFVEPQVRLRLQNGSLPLWRPRHGFAGQMTFERISVTNGRLILDDPAVQRAYSFDDIALTAEADTLTGPFRGDGHVEMDGAATAFRFSTGARTGANLPMKLTLDENAIHPSVDLDGMLVFGANTAAFTLPTVNGTLHLVGTGAFGLPWEASGTLDATLRKAALTNLDLQLGNDLTTSLDGQADLDMGATPRLRVKLQTHQLDLDRLLSAKDQPPPMQRLVSAFGDAANAPNAMLFGLPLSLDLSSDTVILGGDALSDLTAGYTAAGPQADDVRFSAEGPGGAHLALDGQVETGGAPAFKGQVSASAEDFARFRDWLVANAPSLAPPDLPFQSFDIGGDANISQVGIVASNLILHLNGSVLSGTLAYTKKIAADRARLFADLSAQRLELDGVPDLSKLAQRTADMDLALRFDAHSVKLSGLKSGAIETGQIQFDFAKTGAASQLKDLQVSGFNGANVTASGHWNPATGGELALQLDAAHIGEIASLVAQLAPGIETRFIAAHSSEFSPTRLAVALKADATTGTAHLTGFSAAGTAGTTQFLAKAKPSSGENLDVSLHAESAEVRPLLRQLGFRTFPGRRLGRAVINANAQGSFAHLTANLKASLAGADLDFNGDIAHVDTAPHAAGTLKMTSSDLSGLLYATGFADPNLQINVPIDLSAATQLDAAGVVLNALSGSCGSAKISGSLSYAGDRGVTGTLQTDNLSLGALLQIGLGPTRRLKPGVLWSDLPFAAPIKVPPALVSMHVGTFQLTSSLTAQDADFNLLLASGEVALQHFSAKLNSGRLLADLTLRRDGAAAAVQSHINTSHVALDVPTARGLMTGKIDFAGTGQSAAGLVTGLAGAGTITFNDLLLARSDPSALAQIVSDVEEERLSIDETEIDRALSDAFDRHPLAVDAANFDVGLAAGVLRLTGQASTPVGGHAGVTQLTDASLDLRKLRLDQSSLLTLTALPRNWTGAPPQIAIGWTGPLGGPVRSLDATSFVNALAARAIARETERIEAQEFDVHEHAVALNRLQNIRRQEDDRLQAVEDLKQAAARADERAATLDRLRDLLAAEKRAQPLPITPAGAPPMPARPPPAQAPPTPADPSAAGRY